MEPGAPHDIVLVPAENMMVVACRRILLPLDDVRRFSWNDVRRSFQNDAHGCLRGSIPSSPAPACNP